MKVIHKPAKVWYLDIKNPKSNYRLNPDFRTEKQFPVDLREYRKIYTEVGGPWDWANRLILSDAELLSILSDSKNEIYYCYYKDEFAGYYELDCHKDEIELVYFGLSPKFIGQGLGKQMMQSVIKKAEGQSTPRLWLHTCEFDSPQALDFYLKSGFTIYDEKIENQIIIQKD